MYVESALQDDARRRMRQIGKADLIVGIPSYRKAGTIGKVIDVAAEGLLKHFSDLHSVVVVADGLSTDNTREIARETPVPRPVEKIVTTYQGQMGKGSALRAIFEITERLEAQACVIVDADLKNITRRWIRALATPILQDNYDYILPLYSQPLSDLSITHNIVYPMIRVMYGYDVRQPIAGEVALSGELAASYAGRDVWETDVAKAGVHVWTTCQAISKGLRIAQVPLGTKIHDSRDPMSGFEPKFQQVVGTLFRMLTIHRETWPVVDETRRIPTLGQYEMVEPVDTEDISGVLIEVFQKGAVHQKEMWAFTLRPDNLEVVDKVLRQGEEIEFPHDAWARIVYDLAVVYNKGETDPDKIMTTLVPLYFARVASMLRETRGMSWPQVEKEVIGSLAATFLALKPYLIERWESYVPSPPSNAPGSN